MIDQCFEYDNESGDYLLPAEIDIYIVAKNRDDSPLLDGELFRLVSIVDASTSTVVLFQSQCGQYKFWEDLFNFTRKYDLAACPQNIPAMLWILKKKKINYTITSVMNPDSGLVQYSIKNDTTVITGSELYMLLFDFIDSKVNFLC